MDMKRDYLKYNKTSTVNSLSFAEVPASVIQSFKDQNKKVYFGKNTDVVLSGQALADLVGHINSLKKRIKELDEVIEAYSSAD